MFEHDKPLAYPAVETGPTEAVGPGTALDVARHPVLAGVAGATIEQLLAHVHVRHWRRGRTISAPYARPAVHLVLDGCIWMYALTTEGRRLILDRLSPGDVDGLMGLAGIDGHFSQAAEDSDVASIALTVVRRLAMGEPTFAANLFCIAVRRLQRRQDQLKRLTVRDPNQRIADQMLALARSDEGAGRSPERGWWAPRISHEALADMLALRRETVTLHLIRMQQLGALRADGRRYLLDLARLQTMRAGASG